jgi:tRNA threonylcarbamoyl adenosine modification protein (Sua5/YciO/YrdC/YwlC family)
MLLHIHPDNPDKRKIALVVECLKDGGVIVFPTDTIYALGCDIYNPKAFEKVCRIKGVKPEHANFSFIMSDLGNIAAFTKPFDRAIFKLLNRALPGAYTFVLDASSEVPSIFRSKKKSIGIRIPANNITQHIVTALGNPVMATSLHSPDVIKEYPVDAEEIHEQYDHEVDIVIDGGAGSNIPSTIIDCTGGQPKLIREGLGDISVIEQFS